MTSELAALARAAAGQRQLYVWVWLPAALDPVVAGVLTRTESVFDGQAVLSFTYAASYRARAGAIALFTSELPLRAGTFDPTAPAAGPDRTGTASAGVTLAKRSPLPMHSCLRDGSPDAWGRRVINMLLASNRDAQLDELTYLAASGSNRIGALDFQLSPTDYEPRGTTSTLEQLLHAAELIEAGMALPDELAAAFGPGTSIGGARPKALLEDGGRHLIAKFTSTGDARPVVQAEAVAMLLAARVGITAAPVEVRVVDGRPVLLVERFDRPADGSRIAMVSALTFLGLAEYESRHASYADLADAVRTGPWHNPGAILRELFTRLVFSVCVGNNDDHLRNHAAFWDGRRLALTPAYDIAPSPRSTQVSSQAIGVTRDGRRASQLSLCREAAGPFLLDRADAEAIIERVVATIRADWVDVCDEALLTATERASLWEREFLNPYIFYDAP
jgi:serine/threonine-protein kinase HipA